jgi:hypothetical protein
MHSRSRRLRQRALIPRCGCRSTRLWRIQQGQVFRAAETGIRAGTQSKYWLDTAPTRTASPFFGTPYGRLARDGRDHAVALLEAYARKFRRADAKWTPSRLSASSLPLTCTRVVETHAIGEPICAMEMDLSGVRWAAVR